MKQLSLQRDGGSLEEREGRGKEDEGFIYTLSKRETKYNNEFNTRRKIFKFALYQYKFLWKG